MKRRTKDVNRTARKNRRPARVPTYEDCLTHFFDSIDYSSSHEKPQRLPAAEKLKLRRFDHQPERLTLAAYRRIIRKLWDQNLPGLQALGKPQADMLEEEIREILRRCENLLLQLTIGHADARQVRWSLCVRFFVPWIALRMAFRLRHRPQNEFDDGEHWFLPPTSRKKIGSCFMWVVDQHVRKRSDKSQEALARRLCATQKAGDTSDAAKNLGRDFSRYRKGDCTPSDARLAFIQKGCPQTPGLLARMVLARAIDRNVQDAIRAFGHDHALKLVTFFRVSFDHFARLLQRLDAEFPKDDERAWLYLQSQTYSGSTPFEADRYYPLTDPYMNQLAQKISTELQNADEHGRLAYVPTLRSDFGKGKFAPVRSNPLPDGIHEAVRNGDFALAVTASQAAFTSESRNTEEAARIGGLFSHMALSAYDPATANCALTPSENDAPQVLNEAARLLGLAYDQTEGVQKVKYGIMYLRFLLAPHRPKTKAERPLARKLLHVAARFYRESGREGSSMFLHGCLLWLEGNEKRAVRAFMKAAKYGRASFAELDWIRLFQYAPSLAAKTSKRALKRFLKLSEHEGVLYREGSPRTNLLEMELREQANTPKPQITFVLFPD